MGEQKEKGDIVRCLEKTLHHVEVPHKVDLMSRLSLSSPSGKAIDSKLVAHQFGRITAEVGAAIDHIKKIRDAAQKAGCLEVLELLDQQIEF